MSIEFLITSFIVVLLPGTGVIYTLAIGLGRGFRASAVAAFGCTLGILPSVVASVVGLAALLHTSALAFSVVKYLGVLYLFYMAWTVVRDGSILDVVEDKADKTNWRITRDAVALNALNPKLSIFFLAFLPQFVSPNAANPTLAMLGLALVFMAMTFAVFLAYGGLASMARNYVIKKPTIMRWLKQSFACAFALLGFRLAFSER